MISIFVDRLRGRRGVDVHGDGRQLRDFIFVNDVVRFLLAGMDKADVESRVFNVCTGRGTAIVDLARAIGGVLGHEPAIAHKPPRAGDIRASLGNPDAARRFLSVTATTRLEDGLRTTIAAAPAK